MSKFIDLTGQRFDRLRVMKFIEIKKGQTMWLCKCDCNNERVVSQGHLKTGHTKSCGCIRNENIVNLNTTHNMSRKRIYRIYRNMIRRCYDKNISNYFRYGERGIKVCEKWLDKKKRFYELL